MRAVNLIPLDRRRGSSSIGRSGGAVYVLLGALGGLMVLAALYAVANHQVSDRKAQLAQANQRSASAQQTAQQLSTYKQFADLRVQREGQIVTLANGRFDWPGAMHNVASALPAGVHLSTFDASLGTGTPGTAPAPASAGAAGAAPPGTPSVHLVGCASSHSEVGDIINRLRGIPAVTSVAFATSSKGSATPGAAGSSSAPTGACGPTSAQFDVTVLYKPVSTQPTPAPGAPGPPAAGAAQPAGTAAQPASPAQPAGTAAHPASPAQPAAATPSSAPTTTTGGHP